MISIKDLPSISTIGRDLPKISQTEKSQDTGGFSKIVSDSMNSVNGELKEAQKMSTEFLAEGKHELHEVIIALEKADLSFRYMSQVRNKVLDAYQEVMRMQV